MPIPDTFQITVNRLTPALNENFWFATKNGADEIQNIGYSDNKTIKNISPLYSGSNFYNLLVALNTGGVDLPTVDTGINIDEDIQRYNLISEFQPSVISNAQITLIAAGYDPVILCKMLGAYPLIARFYLNGNLTLIQLRDIYIHLGKTGKATRERVDAAIDWLLYQGDITPTQAKDFWVLWNTEVGN